MAHYKTSYISSLGVVQDSCKVFNLAFLSMLQHWKLFLLERML